MNLWGAMMSLGAVEGEQIEINGSIQIAYSSQAIEAALSSLTDYEIVSWLQR